MTLDSAQFWVQALITFVGTGGLLGGLQIWRDRRKADAEAGKENASAAEIISDTAASRLIEMAEELKETKRLSNTRRRAGSKLLNYVHSHERWDQMMLDKLADNGIIIDPPPRLVLNDEETEALEI